MGNLKIGKVVVMDMSDLSFDDLEDLIYKNKMNNVEKIKHIFTSGGWSEHSVMSSKKASTNGFMYIKNGVKVLLLKKEYINANLPQVITLIRQDKYKNY